MNISAHKMVINVLCFTLLHKIPDHVEFISAKWKNMIYKRGVGGGGKNIIVIDTCVPEPDRQPER